MLNFCLLLNAHISHTNHPKGLNTYSVMLKVSKLPLTWLRSSELWMEGDLWQIWLVRGSTVTELVLILLGLISHLPLRACIWYASCVFAPKEMRLKFNIMLYFINVPLPLKKVFNGSSGFIVQEPLTSSCCSSIVNVPGESTLRRDFLRLQQENKERSEALRRQQLLQEQQLREQEEYKRQLLAERQKRIEQQKEQRRRLEEVETEGWCSEAPLPLTFPIPMPICKEFPVAPAHLRKGSNMCKSSGKHRAKYLNTCLATWVKNTFQRIWICSRFYGGNRSQSWVLWRYLGGGSVSVSVPEKRQHV